MSRSLTLSSALTLVTAAALAAAPQGPIVDVSRLEAPSTAPAGARPSDERRAELDAALLALADGGTDLAAAKARAAELGRGLLVLVVGDRDPGTGPAPTLQEELLLGLVVADPRVAAEVAGKRLVVVTPADLAARRAFEAEIEPLLVSGRLPERAPTLAELAPPALALLDDEGRFERALERVLPVDPGSVAAWLGGAALPREHAADDGDAAAYTDAARRPGTGTDALEALAAGKGPLATKALLRCVAPRACEAFELLRAPQNERLEHLVAAEARVRLREVQRPDGSFAGSALALDEAEALARDVLATVAAALALHRVGDHDGAEAAVQWLRERVPARAAVDPLVATLWLDVHLARYGVGWSRTEDVEAAVALLQGCALPAGGFAAGGSFGAAWVTAAPSGEASSVHTGFALDALLRAKAAEFLVDEALVLNATKRLEATRGAAGSYSDFLPAPPDGSTAGLRAVQLVADAALTRQGLLKRRPLTQASDAALGELSDARAVAGMGGVGRRHAAHTGEGRALGWLAYARMTNAAPGRPYLRRDGRLRREIVAAANHDSTWCDVPEHGWVLATALALVALEETR